MFVHLSVQIRVRPITFFLVWHWLTIFGVLVYHHETMCRVHSWSQYDVYLWPQCRIYRVYDMALCKSHSFFVLWHSHAMLSTCHECFPMVRCVTYIHDLYMTLTFDLIKILHLPGIWAWQDRLAYRYITMGQIFCTFLTFVWPWPLTYMWMVILSEFYS